MVESGRPRFPHLDDFLPQSSHSQPSDASLDQYRRREEREERPRPSHRLRRAFFPLPPSLVPLISFLFHSPSDTTRLTLRGKQSSRWTGRPSPPSRPSRYASLPPFFPFLTLLAPLSSQPSTLRPPPLPSHHQTSSSTSASVCRVVSSSNSGRGSGGTRERTSMTNLRRLRRLGSDEEQRKRGTRQLRGS